MRGVERFICNWRWLGIAAGAIPLLFLPFSGALSAQCATDGMVWEDQGISDDGAISSGSSFVTETNIVTATWSTETDGGSFVANRTNGFVTYESGTRGGHAGYAYLGFNNSSDDPDDRILLTLTFSVAVTNLAFSVTDVDSGSWDDGIEVFYNGTTNVKSDSSLYTLGSDVIADNESYMNGFEGDGSSVANSSTTGNVDFDFGTTSVSSVTIEYFSTDDANSNPPVQVIGITDLTFDCADTTVAVVSDFSALIDGQGVIARWETVSESGTIGFVLERWDGETFVAVGPGMTPAGLGTPQGSIYEVRDPNAGFASPLTYRLTEIEADGGRRLLGPYTVSELQPANGDLQGEMRRRTRTNRPGLAALRGALSAAANLRVPGGGASAFPASKRAVVEVGESGLYKVSREALAAVWGVPVGKVSGMLKRNRVRVRNLGQPVPWLAQPGGEGLWFYGERSESPFSLTNPYWIERRRGSKMQKVPTDGGRRGRFSSFREARRYEVDDFPVTVLPGITVENFWFWRSVFSESLESVHASIDLEVVDAVPGSAGGWLQLEIQGVTPGPHAIRTRFAGMDLGTTSWIGVNPHKARFPLMAGLPVSGSNLLEIESVPVPDEPPGAVLLDAVTLEYERALQAVGDRLEFSVRHTGAVLVRGFSSSAVRLFDISDPKRPIWLPTKVKRRDGSFVLGFRAEEDHRYLAVADPGILVPHAVRAATDSELRSDLVGASYVVIAPRALSEGAERLAQLRSGGDLTARVVELEEIYDEFSFSEPTPKAIQRFVRFAFRSWQTPPRLVVLAAAGTFDYRNLQTHGDNLLPPFLLSTISGLVPSDRPFGLMDHRDRAPKVVVGRIPARTNAELEAYVDKIADWERHSNIDYVLSLSDDADRGGNFPEDVEMLTSALPATSSRHVSLEGQTTATARASMFEAFEAGVGLVQFGGHGGVDRFTSEGLVTSADAGLLTGMQLPVVISLTCNVNRFDIPGFDSLGESLILGPHGAAVAFGPTGQALNSESMAFGEHLLAALFNPSNARVGDALLEAWQSAAEIGSQASTLGVYNVLGDPAWPLH